MIKRSFYNTTLSDKGINQVGQLFDTNGPMKWSEFKSVFDLSKNSNFHWHWIRLDNANPKAWKGNLSKGDENLHGLIFSGYHIIKMYQIYSLGKSNSKELCSLQVSWNDSKTTWEIFFENIFQNEEMELKCIYLMRCRVSTDTNLRIFHYKI